MDKRYSVSPEQFKRMTTDELRAEFLITELFTPDALRAVYSHVDRMITLGAMPVSRAISLGEIDARADLGVDYFLERRELGAFNVGGAGRVTVDGKIFRVGARDCVYIAKGAREALFESDDPASPAKFYMVSAPAHAAYETRLLTIAEAAKRPLGTREDCNKRVINQFIHPSVVKTCQLSMGMTVLEPGCVWNTMPAHTHERRMEIYFYFDLPENQAVFHMLGAPDETRHIITRNGQAVINPSWSVHSGAGTSAYSFIWAMGGENQAFDDMDNLKISDLR